MKVQQWDILLYKNILLPPSYVSAAVPGSRDTVVHKLAKKEFKKNSCPHGADILVGKNTNDVN